jgi:ABC-2 type transport system ATP-binding protein
MTGEALVCERVTRSFGKTIALDALDLAIAPGEVLGVVGRNGAGKTTLLRLAAGILWPDSGTIRTLGLDPVTEGLAVRERASLLSEESALYPWMTVGEILDFAAALHPRWDASIAERTVARLALDRTKKIQTLSRGTRAKVALALAIAPRPELLLLDDPTAGLDPLVRREVLEGILDAVAGEGGAVVYASHLVHDIERVADRVVVLDEGRIVLEGRVEDLKARVRQGRAVVESDAIGEVAFAGLLDARKEGRVLTVIADAPDGSLEAALRGLGASSVEIEPLPLEEILVAVLRRGGEETHHV